MAWGQHEICTRGDSTTRSNYMSVNSFTGRPAVSPHGRLGRPSSYELANRATPWDRLLQTDRVCRQQYGGSNDEKTPHLEEHFSAANADSCHRGSVRARLPQGTAAEPNPPQCHFVRSVQSCTHVHPWVSHGHTFDAAFVQLAEWYFGVESDGVEVDRQIKDIVLIDRRWWRRRFILNETFR